MRFMRTPSLPTRGLFRNRATGKLRVWPILLFGAFFVFTYLNSKQEVPITGRTQLVDISLEDERALGLSSYREILHTADIITSGPELDMVRSVTARLVQHVDEANFDWVVNLIRSDQQNAFALPGGKLAVYTGILPITQNESGLAVVLGHEIAHAVARHGAERMTQQKLVQLGSLAVGMSTQNLEPETQRIVMAALGVGSQVGVVLPFSRKHESEADYMGLIFLARACFDPEEAPKVWQRMAEASRGSAPPEFLSTHPAPETRIVQFNKWMNEAKNIYLQSCS